MIISLLKTLIMACGIAFVSCACGQNNAVSASGEKPRDAKPSQPSDSWVYHSEEHGFSLVLPSSNWKQSKKKIHIVDFWCNRFGSPMIAGVPSVEKQTADQFREAIAKFKSDIEKKSMGKPTFESGETKSGNLYIFSSAREKGAANYQYFQVGISRTWIKDKGITVTVLCSRDKEKR